MAHSGMAPINSVIRPQQCGVLVQSVTVCAYNQTRECFLALEITAGEYSSKELRLGNALRLKPNEGLWLNPFRGIPDSCITSALDLIVLDKDCRVIQLVESFPAVKSDLQTRPASLLVLAPRSIQASETQCGDHLVLCVAEEMKRRLELLSPRSREAESDGGLLIQDEALSSGDIGCEKWEDDPTSLTKLPATTLEEMQPGRSKDQPARPRSWWKRLLNPDRRNANRFLDVDLTAYFWSGGPPVSGEVRDVSSTGLYLVTDERWYPGTLVLMTLQDKNAPEDGRRDAIAVKLRAVRCGPDGVGLQFCFGDDGETQVGSILNETDHTALERFLRRFVGRR